ncbi:toxin-antitoxin system HicB family antitoxin [Dechloromonas sp. ARDL1]|uniref:toxin-antitoxin system HicB family antitoxin n=1 Tax=Dechloromonas sp. ARDL1 TaxID=3322121 RepID=UPI003DA77D00
MKMTTTNKSALEILHKGYVRQLAPDEAGGYVASIMEFPGCVAEGDSADEALGNLERAAQSWIEVAVANGQHIREPIDFDGCSGKLALRMPRTLHKQAAALAELEGCSLNQFIVTALAHYVGGKQLSSKLEQLLHSATFAKVDFRQLNVQFVTESTAFAGRKVIDTPLLEKATTAAQVLGLGLPKKFTEVAHG